MSSVVGSGSFPEQRLTIKPQFEPKSHLSMIVRRVIVVPLLTMTDVSTICVEVMHLQSHLQNLPKTASAPPQQLLPWSMLREQNPSCVSAFTHQTSVFKDCLRAATVCNRKVSRPIFSSPGIPSGSQFKKDDPRLKTFSTQLETNLCQCVHFRPLKLNIYRSLL